MEVMAVEEAFIVDCVEHYGYTEKEAIELWKDNGDYIFQKLWDEYSFTISERIPHKEDIND